MKTPDLFILFCWLIIVAGVALSLLSCGVVDGMNVEGDRVHYKKEADTCFIKILQFGYTAKGSYNELSELISVTPNCKLDLNYTHINKRAGGDNVSNN